MGQSFDFSLIEKLQGIIDLGNDSVLPKLKTGAENTVELAKEVGSESLEKTAEGLVESSTAMCKVFTDLFDVCTELKAKYQ